MTVGSVVTGRVTGVAVVVGVAVRVGSTFTVVVTAGRTGSFGDVVKTPPPTAAAAVAEPTRTPTVIPVPRTNLLMRIVISPFPPASPVRCCAVSTRDGRRDFSFGGKQKTSCRRSGKT